MFRILISAGNGTEKIDGIPRKYGNGNFRGNTTDDACGAVLEQFQLGRWAPLNFWSRKFKGAETRYSTYDRELLSAFSAVKEHRHILEGNPFQLRLDHKPVIQALARRTDSWNSRQARQLSFLSEFSLEPVFVPGLENRVADALSRAPCDGSPTTLLSASLVASPSSSSPVPVSLVASPSAAAPSRASFIKHQSSCAETQALFSSPSLRLQREPDGLVTFVSRGG